MKTSLKRGDLIYPDICYKIVGVLFDVYNKIGYGRKEIFYQKAVSLSLKNAEIKFQEQVYAPFIFEGIKLGKNYFDFLIENKIILELKQGIYFSNIHIKQVYNYLTNNNLKLGIIATFTPKGLFFKRIINTDSYIRTNS